MTSFLDLSLNSVSLSLPYACLKFIVHNYNITEALRDGLNLTVKVNRVGHSSLLQEVAVGL